ncbi:MAG: hypothetical protein JW939_09310 [Candidatus Thermoplasmatota archaeon]|nr:hypothetical protein [Candidatus Thermoplasmatota archaeon]
MPHQCLNCGRMIERGSKEILKGCGDCGGKKFMFVDTPLPQEEREDLKRKADRVRDEMLKKADPEFFRILKEKGIGNIDGAQVKRDGELGEDWVRVKLEGGEGPVSFRGGAGSGPILEQPSKDRISAKDLISQFDREIEARKRSAPSTIHETKQTIEKVSKGKKQVKRKKVVKGPPGPGRGKGKRKGKQVDVINIVEQGVYEIDVKRLLEDNPIVIQKDGSYLIHLPSLFKEGRDRAKK